MSDFNERQLLRLLKDVLNKIESNVDAVVINTRTTDQDVQVLILSFEALQTSVDTLSTKVDTLSTKIDNLAKPKAVKMVITFHGGNLNMPGQMTDVQTITAEVDELDAAGQPVTLDPTKITWTVGDPTIVALTQNSDGTASFQALKVGQTPVGVNDSSNGLSAQDTIIVTADVATSLVIKFGTPTNSTPVATPAPSPTSVTV